MALLEGARRTVRCHLSDDLVTSLWHGCQHGAYPAYGFMLCLALSALYWPCLCTQAHLHQPSCHGCANCTDLGHWGWGLLLLQDPCPCQALPSEGLLGFPCPERAGEGYGW